MMECNPTDMVLAEDNGRMTVCRVSQGTWPGKYGVPGNIVRLHTVRVQL